MKCRQRSLMNLSVGALYFLIAFSYDARHLWSLSKFEKKMAEKNAIKALDDFHNIMPGLVWRKIHMMRSFLGRKDFHRWLRRYARNLNQDSLKEAVQSHSLLMPESMNEKQFIWCRKGVDQNKMVKNIFTVVSPHIERVFDQAGHREDLKRYVTFRSCKEEQWEKTRAYLWHKRASLRLILKKKLQEKKNGAKSHQTAGSSGSNVMANQP